jgi:predicted small integral membrane protein
MFAVNNTIDFDTNYQYVKHVLTMDTIAAPDSFRAIANSKVHFTTYVLIIIWQYLTCMVGAVGLWNYLKNNEKHLINYALLMGITLYFFGYLIIASEWYLMWQSKLWNGQGTAFQFTILFILVLICFNSQCHTEDRDICS